MHDFGQCLHDTRAANPGRQLVVKDDVASAFLNLPAHPIWQLRQTVTIDGKLYIVRHLVFGNQASPHIWCALSGLRLGTSLDLRVSHEYLCIYLPHL
jgi:hypothetical protein